MILRKQISRLWTKRAEAMLVAQELMRRAASEGRDVSGYAIEICNEAGRSLSVVTFRQARLQSLGVGSLVRSWPANQAVPSTSPSSSNSCTGR
ncbi:DUF6894 family protein [Rhizobium leguminosarum]|uniref:DUF6894 family protein n=1 Tax=Rhizobium leguminosarum TaxID=384 RepID=UPI003AF14851